MVDFQKRPLSDLIWLGTGPLATSSLPKETREVDL